MKRSYFYQTPEIDNALHEKIDQLKLVISNLENNFSDQLVEFIDKNYKIK